MSLKVLAILLTFNFALLTCFEVFSQSGVAINTTGVAADASAILDISSSNQGILIPRLTEAQKQAIPLPIATGLMIYQTDGTSGFWYYNGVAWVQSIGVAGITGTTGATGPLVSGTIGQTLRNDGSAWVADNNLFNTGTNIGIGTTSPNSSAGLDIDFNNKGLLIPRMTTNDRNLIVSPAEGLQIFNTTTKCFEAYISPMWQSIFCGCNPPQSPIASVNITTQTSIEWEWDDVAGATGYQWNTTNTYPGVGVNVLTNSAYLQSGLTCNTQYTLYVWAYNSCGHSTESMFTESTSQCWICGNNVIFNYRGIQVTYGTVNGDYNNGQYCWLNKDLGASVVATSVSHSAAYGDLFQWGRLDDGHQLRSNNVTTTTLSTNDVPGHSKYIVAAGSPYDWRSGQNPLLWQGLNGVNNPCPSGWRVPNTIELENERLSWTGGYNYNGAVNSALHLPSAGWRTFGGSMDINLPGSHGGCWSSTTSGQFSNRLYYNSSGAGINTDQRASGFVVRCIKDY